MSLHPRLQATILGVFVLGELAFLTIVMPGVLPGWLTFALPSLSF